MTIAVNNPKSLPLHDRHASAGARFGAFGEWNVPLYYTSIIDEHMAVRQKAGLFDISHMGEIFVAGNGAEAFLNSIFCRDFKKMALGQALYMPLLSDDGGILDDIIAYRYQPNQFLLIVNAANRQKDYGVLEAYRKRFCGDNQPTVQLTDLSDDFGLLALQGPLSGRILEEAIKVNVSDLGYYRFQEWKSGVIARTGYTGEDGFEIMAPLQDLGAIWDALIETGRSFGLLPCGFGARDTLRLEAGMPLYGQDMTEETHPLAAGIGWTLDWKKPTFLAQDILCRQKEENSYDRLAGLEVLGRGIPRHDCELFKDGRQVGRVTSGGYMPYLKKNVAMGYLPPELAQPGNEIEVRIRENLVPARVVPLPFYRRKKQSAAS